MRFIVRFIGLIILALGFIGIVIDGTRSMANATLWFTSLNDAGNVVFPTGIEKLQAGVAAYAPAWLWDHVCVGFLHLPASVVGFVLGALLVKLGDGRRHYSGFEGITPVR